MTQTGGSNKQSGSKKYSGTLILKETKVYPTNQDYSATYNEKELKEMIRKYFPDLNKN